MYQNIKYFPGLNGLRFFAAFLVVLHHSESIKLKQGWLNLKSYSLFNNGSLAVTFFFVLSGFLITYLLFKERTKTNSTAVKKFYLRRILRIWPLYFLLVAIGTVIIPALLTFFNSSLTTNAIFSEIILYYIFFMPFMVNILFGGGILEPLWSIGVEEVFYLFWAPLFKKIKKLFIPTIVTLLILKVVLGAVLTVFKLEAPLIYELNNLLQFEAMLFGAIVSYWLYHTKKDITKNKLFKTIPQLVILGLIFIQIFCFKTLKANSDFLNVVWQNGFLLRLYLIALFSWLIVNTAVNPKSVLKINHRWFNVLGDISYGIYMYHIIIIVGITTALATFKTSIAVNIIFYPLLLLLTITISYVSKRYFEDYFLKFKKRFETYNAQSKDLR